MPQVIIKAKDGTSLSPEKAKLMLRENKANGKVLTNKQKRFLGFIAGGGKAENGATIQQLSVNPYSSPIMQFNGPSHEQGGIPLSYGGQDVEVEGQETAFVDSQQNLNILGNLKVPGTRMKFKNAGKQIADEELKTAKQLDKGIALINEANPYDRFERLKFNSGAIMAKGAEIKQKELTAAKEGLVALQDDILQQAQFLGVEPKQLQSGKAKYGIKLAQEGGTYPWMAGVMPRPQYIRPVSNPEQLYTPPTPTDGRLSLAQRHNNPGNMMYNPKLGTQQRNGAVQGEPRYQNGKLVGHYAKFPTIEAGQRAMQDLLTGPSYRNLTVEQASNRWTGEGAYKNIPKDLRGVKIKDLNPQQLVETLNTFTKGEDSKLYNWNLPEMPSTGITLPEVEIVGRRTPPPINPNFDFGPDPSLDPGAPPYPPVELITPQGTPSTTTTPQTTRPAYRNPLKFSQIAPEILTLATERASFVPGQRFEPQLYQPYQVSFQDQLNENQATFSALSRQLGGSRNSAALSSLAAQKYQADSQVLANEFRTNQGITNDITNKNIALLNQAQLTNLELNDTQFARQEQAQTNTRAQVRAAAQSIADKITANRMENVNYTANQQVLFPQYAFDPTGQVSFIPNEGLVIGNPTAAAVSNPYQSKRVTYDSTGQPSKTTISTPSQVDQEAKRNREFFENLRRTRNAYSPSLFQR